MTRLPGKLLHQLIHTVLLPLGGAMLALDGGETPDEATGIHYLPVVIERGTETDNIFGLDAHKPMIEGSRGAEEICIYTFIWCIKHRIQNRVGIHFAIPDAANNLPGGPRGTKWRLPPRRVRPVAGTKPSLC